MSVNLHFFDYLIIVVYIVTMFGLGIFGGMRGKRRDDPTDFLLAGRSLTLPSFVATLVATWYGGILGIAEFTYRHGLVNWVVFGCPYYLAALIFALFLARKARAGALFTIPEQLDRCYGKFPAIFGALFLYFATVPAAYILMLAIILQILFGIPMLPSLILAMSISTIYAGIGGLRSVVRTEIFQMILMYGSFLTLLPIAANEYGGAAFLRSHLPEAHLSLDGGLGGQYIFMWFILALSTLVEPAIYQRCFAAKNEKTAQRGIFVSVAFWLVFDFLTTMTGLYARAILPDLAEPAGCYLTLANLLLPPVVLGFFICGILAIVMSTIDSYMFIAAITLSRDLFGRSSSQPSSQRSGKATKIGLVISGVTAIVIAWYERSVISIWKDIGSIATPVLLLPLVLSFSQRFRVGRLTISISMIGSALSSTIWLFLSGIGVGSTRLFGIEPIFPGLGFSLLTFVVDRCVVFLRKH